MKSTHNSEEPKDPKMDLWKRKETYRKEEMLIEKKRNL
jgi:hypothetical protein